MKPKKREKVMIGICGYCCRPIYSTQKWELMYCDEPAVWERMYRQGRIHYHCRLPMLKRFNRLLMQNIETLTWMLDGIISDDCSEEKKRPKWKLPN